jgi:hypothetical protein
MAFSLGFETQDYNQGKSILVVDTSTDWANVPVAVTYVTFTITSLYPDVTLVTTPVVVTVLNSTVAFQAGFQYEITGVELFGAGYVDTVQDNIYDIKMEIYNISGKILTAGCNYESDEVFYYNASYLRDNFIVSKASYTNDIHDKDIEYANWLDFMVTSIESNATYGNTSAIYYAFDVLKTLE